MKSILKFVTHKVFVVAVILLIELCLLLYITWNLSANYAVIYAGLLVLSVFLVIYVFNRNDNPAYQLSWSVLIMAFPPFGFVLYLMFGGKKAPKRLRQSIKDVFPKDSIQEDKTPLDSVVETYPHWERLVRYIRNSGNFPIYDNTASVYLESGEKKLEYMLEALRSAQRFIFMEYFIVKEGAMWQSVLAVLREKAKQGVDVRIIFDDWGTTLFTELEQQCRDAGIECIFFNPLVPRLAIQMNNRDHRKICVVDGRIGFVGGINLADEYINIGSRFGHWKDTAVQIEGEAVYTLTLMFLQFYRYYTGRDEDPLQFRYESSKLENGEGYVMPFSDAPTDSKDIGMDVHLNMIHTAKRYIYIQTPYLVVGYEMIQALIIAARSGVDVRIILPHIPDKKVVNHVTKSNYRVLVENGIRIYEYTPGFVHSKTVVVDDEICSVGTINMDFRSYYMHYECSILFIQNNVVQDCYDDVMRTLAVSQEITLEEVMRVPLLTRWYRSILRMFSSLM